MATSIAGSSNYEFYTYQGISFYVSNGSQYFGNLDVASLNLGYASGSSGGYGSSNYGSSQYSSGYYGSGYYGSGSNYYGSINYGGSGGVNYGGTG